MKSCIDSDAILFSLAVELVALRTQNAKLKYRKEFLQKSISEMNPTAVNGGSAGNIGTKRRYDELSELNCMDSLLGLVSSLFREAITRSYPDLENPPVDVNASNRDGIDYQCNSAMQIAKLLSKQSNKKTSPREIATTIVNNVPQSNVVKKIDIAGPGFINISLDDAFISNKIRSLLIDGISVRRSDNKNRIVVDYSSPNIAKEMHVGHLRSTIIGDSIANILEFLGYSVIRLNHVGDWGTQFGMLLTHLVESFPDYMNKPPPIADLQTFYKEAKKRFDEDAEFKKRSYAAVVRLQSKQTDMYKAWQLICDISRREFNEIYKTLNISPNLIERGESFYHDFMNEVVAYLVKSQLLVEDDGRKIMWPKENKEGIPLTVVKSDGGYTYDTSDMACIKHRVECEKADRIIYITDAGQSTHFKLIFACAAEAGFYDPNKVRVDHVGFGVVLGEDKKKFKTRSGDTVRLRDLLDEGKERALKKLMQKESHKNPDRDNILTKDEIATAQDAIAIGCIKYADLSHDRNHEYEFSFDRMLDDKGNTAVYLLYSLTRIRSISRNANLTTSPSQRAAEINNLVFEHEKEIKLSKHILKFPDVILQVADDLYPHSLCSYLYELSVVFSEFYDKCYCIERYEENGQTKTRVNMSRILLCEATALVMEKCLALLGIKTVSKM